MAPGGLCVQPSVVGGKTYWIAPFGNLRIKVYLPLPEAYRSLSRPSSPDGAKASVVRPYTLSRKILNHSILKPSRSVTLHFSQKHSIVKDQKFTQTINMVEAAGVEPATSSLQSWRSTN